MAVNDAWDILKLAGQHFRDNVAYVDPDSQKTLTYSQLLSQGAHLASWLQRQGIQRGDRIAVMLHNCIEAIQLHFAAAAIHAIVVNINTHWVDREIQLVLEDSSPQLIFLHPQYLGPVQAAMLAPTNTSVAQLPSSSSSSSVSMLILVSSVAATAAAKSQLPQTAYTAYAPIMADFDTNTALERPAGLSDRDGYEMYYTSGTTGRPKGVVLSQRIVITHALGTIQGVNSSGQSSACDSQVHIHQSHVTCMHMQFLLLKCIWVILLTVCQLAFAFSKVTAADVLGSLYDARDGNPTS